MKSRSHSSGGNFGSLALLKTHARKIHGLISKVLKLQESASESEERDESSGGVRNVRKTVW